MILALDIGGTNLKLALVTPSGRIVERRMVPSHAASGKKEFLKALTDAIQSLMSTSVRAIGIGCPGPLDVKRGIILSSSNLHLYRFPLRSTIQKKFRKPVILDNDANCFTLGEALRGAGKNYRTVVGLTLGTGVGGGIVFNKTLYRGRSNAGELGHVTLDMNGPKGGHGDRGSFEEYVSSRALRPILLREGVESAKALDEKARAGNVSARLTFQDYGIHLGIGLASIVHVLDPDCIVLGGQLAKAWPFFASSLKKTLKERTIFTPPPVLPSKLGTDAALIGAAFLTTQKQ